MSIRVGALVLHGFTSTTASVQPLADALNQHGYTTELPLLPGHGTQWQDLAATSADEVLGATLDAYDRLSATCDTVVPMGLSMGGGLALWAAAQRGAAGVAAINPGLRLKLGTGAAARVLSMVRPTIASIAGDIARPGVTEEAYPVTPVRAVVELNRIFAHVRGALPELHRRQIPVLLLRSPVDAVVGSASAALLKRELPGHVTEVILRRSRHVATLDLDADLLQRRVVRFLGEMHS